MTHRPQNGLLVLTLLASTASAADPLPSWNDTAPKKAILAFVDQVTRTGSPDFVTLTDRVAVFDNDGTLWSEQPMYVEIAFLLDRVKELAPQHPEWKSKRHFDLIRGHADCLASNSRSRKCPPPASSATPAGIGPTIGAADAAVAALRGGIRQQDGIQRRIREFQTSSRGGTRSNSSRTITGFHRSQPSLRPTARIRRLMPREFGRD